MTPARARRLAIDDALRELAESTVGLVTAIEDENPEAIARALAERGRIIDRLEPHFETLRRQDALDERLRAATAEVIASGARALEALEKARLATAKTLARLARDSVAIRAYGDELPGKASLDRSG